MNCKYLETIKLFYPNERVHVNCTSVKEEINLYVLAMIKYCLERKRGKGRETYDKHINMLMRVKERKWYPFERPCHGLVSFLISEIT